MKKINKSFAALLICSSTMLPYKAEAAVSVLDNSVLLQVKSVLSNAQSQLGQLQQISGIVQQVQQSIGTFGLGNFSSILGQISSLKNLLGGGGGSASFTNILNGLQPTLSSASSFGNMAGNSTFSSQLSSLTSTFGQASQGVSALKSGIGSSMWLSGSASTTQADVEGMQAVRSVALKEAATTASATGLALREDVATNGSKDLKELAEQVSGCKDLRCDVAANSAIMLKILEALQKNNGATASLINLQGTQNIANSNVLK